MKKGKILSKIIACILVVLLICTIIFIAKNKKTGKLKSVKSDSQLYNIYNNDEELPMWVRALTVPFSMVADMASSVSGGYSGSADLGIAEDAAISSSDIGSVVKSNGISKDNSTSSSSSSRDYSKTNIQVENVDEADITKTDGDFIYSISEDNVVITDVRDPQNIKIVTKFNNEEDALPVDLMLYNNTLAVISENNSYNSDTYVSIYDITEREKPILEKSYSVNKKYYTSRCINNKLYVISNGYLKVKKGKKINREYIEDSQTKEIPLKNIKYIDGMASGDETIISVCDLDNPRNDVKINAYLLNITNAYVSENNIYLTDYQWNDYDIPPIRSMFGLKGIFGIRDYIDNNEHSYGRETRIMKFRINDGDLQYISTAIVDGLTINQYSMDEKDGHLRIATYDNDGTMISIFDENMNLIGETNKVAKGEKMYSSRFMGNRAYLITYKTVDPLFVVDLSNESNPTILGELKISGYSAYLHPYDETHLIGIGMETKTTSNRNIYGRVTSSTTKVVGMKMALFDVSDVRRPVTLSTIVIGDSRTTSAILTNPKALLFSREKELIAIPVNNYSTDFSITDSDDFSTIISLYKNSSRNYIGEGYAVYKINLTDGFNLKGLITHKKNTNSSTYNGYDYYYRSSSQMLRGLYIDNNLYTVSNDEIKVNDLETMKEIDEINVQTGYKDTNNNINNNSTNTVNNNNNNNNSIDNSVNNSINNSVESTYNKQNNTLNTNIAPSYNISNKVTTY